MDHSNFKISERIYPNVLIQLRKIMVRRMARPEEVLITTDE